MNVVEMQIECMRKLGVPDVIINKALMYYGDNIKKLIEVEEKYTKYIDKQEMQFIKSNRCKDCIHLSHDDKCHLGEKSCEGCEYMDNKMFDDFEMPEYPKYIKKIDLIENLDRVGRAYVSKIKIQEMKSGVQKTKIWDILKMDNVKKRLRNYSKLLNERYGV